MSEPFVATDGIPVWIKDPADSAPYGLDFMRLLPPGDSVANAVWTVPAPLTGGAETLFLATAQKMIGGGVAGTTYTGSVQITSGLGHVRKRSFRLAVRAR